MNNPLLDFADLPRFDAVQPTDVEPAMDSLLAQAQTALDQVTTPDFPAQWNE
jgi:oligopeptidase A